MCVYSSKGSSKTVRVWGEHEENANSNNDAEVNSGRRVQGEGEGGAGMPKRIKSVG